MSKLHTLFQIGRAFGVRDGLLRLHYELQRSSGLLARRMRLAAGWDRWDLKNIAPDTSKEDFLRIRRQGQRPFFFADSRGLAPDLARVPGANREKSVCAEADSVVEGTLPFFGQLSFACGFPPNWFQNPATRQRVSPDRPWTGMRFASKDYGDLKFILEPSRFLFVYPLVRAYAVSGEDRYAEAFWKAIEDWARTSPPMSGPLWVCGQESALRILAWSFALNAFLHSPATTPRRAALLASMVAAHAWRVEQTVGYARSQRSNHLFSEAVGLWTAGVLYPELDHAHRWRTLGARLLREAVLKPSAPEGAPSQHSFNYHRMVLHLLLWALRLAEIHRIPLDPEIQARTTAAWEFMRGFVDAASGRAPNHGSNDGSDILPLTSCDYGDFRPLLQLGSCVLYRRAALPPGPWDEAALWLCGPIPPARGLASSPQIVSSATGYHRVGTEKSWALVRAGSYTNRPAHADQLHVDLWWHGINLACDAGTYLYNGDPPWNNGLARSAVHNTVVVDGCDQMRRAGRFLWLDWARASGRSFSTQETAAIADCFEGEHDGYRSLGVIHRRMVQCVNEDAWVVVDDLLGTGEHELRLHWLLPDLPWESLPSEPSPSETVLQAPFCVTFPWEQARLRWNIVASAPGQGTIVRAGKTVAGVAAGQESLLGWQSPTYGELSPALSLLYRVKARLPLRLLTVVRIGDTFQMQTGDGRLTLLRGGSQAYQVGLHPVR